MIEQVHPRREAATVSCLSSRSSSNLGPTSALKDASNKIKRDLCLQESVVVLNSLVNSLYSASVDCQSQATSMPLADSVNVHIPFTLEMEKDLIASSEDEIVELDLNAGLDLEPVGVQSCGHNYSRCAKPCMAANKSSHTVNTAITTLSTQFNDSFGNLSLDDCDTEHTRNTSFTAPAVMTNKKRYPRSPGYFASPQSHQQPRHSRHYQSQAQMPMLKQSSSKSDSSFLSSPSPARRHNLSRNKSDPLDEPHRQNRRPGAPRQQRRNHRSTDLDDDAQHSPLRPDHYYSSRTHQPGRHHVLEQQKRQRDARVSRSDRNKAKATSRSLSPKKEESSLAQSEQGPAFRRNSTHPGTPDANGNHTSTTEILIEVQPGVHAPLRRTQEVEHALKMEFYQTVACSHCTETCTIIANAAFVHCPHCKLMSPVVGAVMANQGQEVLVASTTMFQMSDDASSSASSANEEGRYGLALGMTWETMEKVHQEWFHPRD